MRAHRVAIRLCAALGFLCQLASCGGGYGGGEGTAAATVSISVNPTTIALGQTATLTWSSNAGGCTASGAWNGAKPSSGSETVTPSSTGTLTYSLFCAGGGYGESDVLSATLTVNPATGFTPTLIVAQFAGSAAPTTDPDLVAPTGVALSRDGAVWVMTGRASRSPAGIVADATDSFAITSAHLPGADGARYTGLAIAREGSTQFLYATDFRNARIDVFDAGLSPQARSGFGDPNLPAGFAPFGIQSIQTGSHGARLYVTYARRSAADDLAAMKGAGLGFVNVFDTQGRLLQRLDGGMLNAPWGVALAPRGFGALEGAVLVANSGDGTIDAYDATRGVFIGAVSDSRGRPIAIPGLWGIASDGRSLYFTASTDDTDGVYGRIDPERGTTQ